MQPKLPYLPRSRLVVADNQSVSLFTTLPPETDKEPPRCCLVSLFSDKSACHSPRSFGFVGQILHVVGLARATSGITPLCQSGRLFRPLLNFFARVDRFPAVYLEKRQVVKFHFRRVGGGGASHRGVAFNRRNIILRAIPTHFTLNSSQPV